MNKLMKQYQTRELLASLLSTTILSTLSFPAVAEQTFFKYEGTVLADGDNGTDLSQLYKSSASSVTQTIWDGADATGEATLPLYSLWQDQWQGPTTSTQQASAHLNGYVDFGEMLLSADAKASKNVGYYNGTVHFTDGTSAPLDGHNSEWTAAGYGADAGSYTTMIWSDELTSTSENLQVGTPVQLALDWSLSADFTFNGYGNKMTDGNGHTLSYPFVKIYADDEGEKELNYFVDGAHGELSGTRIIEARIGETAYIGARMEVYSGNLPAYESFNSLFSDMEHRSEGGYTDKNTYSRVDAFAKFTLRMPPNIKFSSASGDTYVPLPSQSSLDPFLCWQVVPAKAPKSVTAYPKFSPVQGLTLADSMSSATSSDTRKINLLKPLGLCNSVDINSALNEVLTHPGNLESYLVQRTKTQPAQPKFVAKQVGISNQMGNLTLNLSGLDNFMAPSAMAKGAGGVAALTESSPDHMQCYKAKVAKAKRGQTALPVFTPQELLLQDHLTGPLRFNIAAPTRFCAPASVDDSSAAAYNHPDFLTCYPVKLTKTKPAQAKPVSQLISTQNRFGQEVLLAKTVQELCVPSQLD